MNSDALIEVGLLHHLVAQDVWTKETGTQKDGAKGTGAEEQAASTKLGRVRRVDRGECDVVTAAGEARVISDSQRSQSVLAPAAGDWVTITDDSDAGPRIDQVLDRQTALVRRDPAEGAVEQVLVANMDFVGVVCGTDRKVNLARIERFLVLAMDSGATPLIVTTKGDLPPADERWATLSTELPDVMIVATSAIAHTGLTDLFDAVAGHRSLVLLGESGAGKSALVNALVGEDEYMETGEVREGDKKGRHTTTARELIVLPGGGVLIDTPGIRGVGLWDAEPALERVFADITGRAGDCRFSDCQHNVEPKCAVLAAVADGTLDSKRLERYHRLKDELAEQAEMREEQRRKRRGRPGR